MSDGGLPEWVAFPGDSWGTITPEDAGLDAGRWHEFLERAEVGAADWEGERHGGNDFGCVLTRAGYVLHTWGDPLYLAQSASLGKAFTWAAFGLAVDAGLVSPHDPVRETWTGAGELSHGHKRLDRGHHVGLEWRHLLGLKDGYGHDGGFPVTNGYYWRQRSSAQMRSQAGLAAPEWAAWTGDPSYDNYSHVEPGTQRVYSSGGMWRLSQALTALWGDDLKHVLDDRLFGGLGIPADGWDWTPGRRVHEDRDWYPEMPGYGDFLDPPYEIGGHPVRGGGGWAVMTPIDLARFGHLVATGGIWNGQRVIGTDWLRGHHGGNASQVSGEGVHFTAMGRVATSGIDHLGGPGRDPPVPLGLFIREPSVRPPR